MWVPFQFLGTQREEAQNLCPHEVNSPGEKAKSKPHLSGVARNAEKTLKTGDRKDGQGLRSDRLGCRGRPLIRQHGSGDLGVRSHVDV